MVDVMSGLPCIKEILENFLKKSNHEKVLKVENEYNLGGFGYILFRHFGIIIKIILMTTLKIKLEKYGKLYM